jgi:hypothetical protein
VSATHVPQTRQSIDKSIAIGIKQVRTLSLDPDPGIGMTGILMQGMNHVLLVFIDQGAITERGVHRVNSLSVWAGYGTNKPAL